MVDIRRKKGFYITTLALILLIGFCVKGTVFSREDSERERRNRYYAEQEQEYLAKTRELLDEEGFHNCGVNIRWVSYGNGAREYTVSLHHGRLRRLSAAEKTVLERKISAADFRDDHCSFHYEL